jgi:hypothetical protein
MIFQEQPTEAWVPFDFMLLEAYQMLQDETCPKCGQPVWLCRTSSPNVEFKVRSAICYAERALREAEDLRKERKDRAEKNERKEWGVSYFITPFVPENIEGDLPTRREFYEEMAEAEGNH